MTESEQGPRAVAATVRPMLAVAGELPPDDSGWVYEMKWDGVRAIAGAGGGEVALFSRSGREVTAVYPELAGRVPAVGHEAVLDGEIVAPGEDGWPSFEALQQRINVTSAAQARRLAAQAPVSYLAFDLLFLDGERLSGEPYLARRSRLEDLGLGAGRWQAPPALAGLTGAQARDLSRRHGLEGVMAKRAQSRYEAGMRSPNWRKIKNVLRQEFVVGGWQLGEGMRAGQIGSLLVGVHEPAGLAYAGHVGTGFSQQALRVLAGLLAPLRRASSPFAAVAVPAGRARGAVWVEPELVVEVAFAAWTSAGRLRAPSYLGIRPDKDPADVTREHAWHDERPTQ